MNVGAAPAAISDSGPGATVAEAAATERTGTGVLTLADVGEAPVRLLLARVGLELALVPPGREIPGSYWGESEAGLIACTVFARDETPLHSLLHEASHLLVMPDSRRAAVHTDATDSVAEEDAACYLQILLADCLQGVGGVRLMADMDAWGYTFRLGSARAWFERDAEDALNFLQQNCAALTLAHSLSASLAPPALQE